MALKRKTAATCVALYAVTLVFTIVEATSLAEINIANVRTGDQQDAEVVGLPNGNFAIVWESEIDDFDEDIYLAIFQEDGTKIVDDIVVNTDTAGLQLDPALAVSKDETILVVYESFNGTFAIKSQLFDLNGNKIGNETLIEDSNSTVDKPHVAALENGNFVVAYRDDEDITARLLDGLGELISDQKILVNTFTDDEQDEPFVLSLENGGFAVFYDSFIGAFFFDIVGQLFNANGDKVGTEFIVNDNRAFGQLAAHAARTSNGFVVTWESDHTGDFNVFMQLFDQDANKVGEEVQVNTFDSGDQDDPYIAQTKDGFVIAWETDEPFERVVRLQRYNNAGQKIEGEVEASSFTTFPCSDVGIGVIENGNIVVVFEEVSFLSNVIGTIIPLRNDGGGDDGSRAGLIVGILAAVVGISAVAAVFVYKRNSGLPEQPIPNSRVNTFSDQA